MGKKAKNPPIKKVIVTTSHITKMKTALKPAFVQAVAAKCQNNAACQGSPPCVATLATWVTTGGALGANLKAQDTARTTLALLASQEPALILAYDTAAHAFTGNVQTVTQGDVTIAAGMNMTVRAASSAAITDVAVPVALAFSPLKKTGAPRVEWAPVPGAVLYVAELSVDPASDPTWGVLAGKGKTRMLPPLVAGQHYLVRVAAVGRNGKQSAWSNAISVIGK